MGLVERYSGCTPYSSSKDKITLTRIRPNLFNTIGYNILINNDISVCLGSGFREKQRNRGSAGSTKKGNCQKLQLVSCSNLWDKLISTYSGMVKQAESKNDWV